jgi:hypothetical protein
MTDYNLPDWRETLRWVPPESEQGDIVERNGATYTYDADQDAFVRKEPDLADRIVEQYGVPEQRPLVEKLIVDGWITDPEDKAERESPVTEWACFQQVADVIGQEAAIEELEKVLEAGVQVNKRNTLALAFNWGNSPQKINFWSKIDQGFTPKEHQ